MGLGRELVDRLRDQRFDVRGRGPQLSCEHVRGQIRKHRLRFFLQPFARPRAQAAEFRDEAVEQIDDPFVGAVVGCRRRGGALGSLARRGLAALRGRRARLGCRTEREDRGEAAKCVRHGRPNRKDLPRRPHQVASADERAAQ